MAVILSRKGGGSGGASAGVSSFSESGESALTGAVTLSEGGGISLEQVGQNIEISSTGLSYEQAAVLLGAQMIWLLEDASGNPTDFNGAFPVTTVTGTPDYQVAGPGGRLSMRLSDGEALSRATVYTTAWPFTFVYWIYLESISGADDQYMFFNGNDASNGMGVIFATAAGRKFAAKPGAIAQEADSTSAIPLNSWAMVALRGQTGTFDTGYWFNGAQDKAYDATSQNTPSGGSTRLGKSDTTYTARYFGVTLFPTALTGGQLTMLYQSVMG